MAPWLVHPIFFKVKTRSDSDYNSTRRGPENAWFWKWRRNCHAYTSDLNVSGHLGFEKGFPLNSFFVQIEGLWIPYKCNGSWTILKRHSKKDLKAFESQTQRLAFLTLGRSPNPFLKSWSDVRESKKNLTLLSNTEIAERFSDNYTKQIGKFQGNPLLANKWLSEHHGLGTISSYKVIESQCLQTVSVGKYWKIV